ncbi:hypothetical protein [Sphingobium sp.]|uniref:hypothetical protein n=1 Tax=Sphingobium sp. TaxID=1912891 RepID=UPI003BB760A9
MPQVAGELSHLLGRAVTYHHRTTFDHRVHLMKAGSSEMVAELLLELDLIFKEGILSETTATVGELLGRPARSVSAWLSENLQDFTR